MFGSLKFIRSHNELGGSVTVNVSSRQTANADQIRQRGFTSIEKLIDAEAVADLRRAYDEILDRKVDCGKDDRMLGGVTRQIMAVRSHHPAVAANPVFEAARSVARTL